LYCPPENIGINIVGDCAYFGFEICITLRMTATDMMIKKALKISSPGLTSGEYGGQDHPTPN
jgi:hypothetical protein